MTDELETVALALCEVLATERHAIATLDHAALETLASRKHELAQRLAAVRPVRRTPAIVDVLARLALEAGANAQLALTASDAVRSLLGYDVRGYDRRAQPTTSCSTRVLATP